MGSIPIRVTTKRVCKRQRLHTRFCFLISGRSENFRLFCWSEEKLLFQALCKARNEPQSSRRKGLLRKDEVFLPRPWESGCRGDEFSASFEEPSGRKPSQDPFKPSAQPEVLFWPSRPRVMPPFTNGFNGIMELPTATPAPTNGRGQHYGDADGRPRPAVRSHDGTRGNIRRNAQALPALSGLSHLQNLPGKFPADNPSRGAAGIGVRPEAIPRPFSRGL